jgi:hypothetical protein
MTKPVSEDRSQQGLDAVRQRGLQIPREAQGTGEAFWQEASKYQVLPLDASAAARFVAPRPSLAAGNTQFTWSGPVTGTPNGDAPSILNSSLTYKADVDVPNGGAEGMIVTLTACLSGPSLWQQDIETEVSRAWEYSPSVKWRKENDRREYNGHVRVHVFDDGIGECNLDTTVFGARRFSVPLRLGGTASQEANGSSGPRI